MKRSPLLLALTLVLALLAPSARAQTPFGNALLFNGTTQYVTVPNFGSIIPTNEVTVEFWANTSVATGQSAFILDPDNDNNRLNAHLNYGTSPPQGITYWDFGSISGNPSGRLGNIAAPVNSISNWVHYAFVASQSGNFMSIYANGTLLATKTGMTPFVRGAYDLHIGGSSNYFGYNGTLDDFRVWNVALSQAQIQANLGVTLTGNETNLLLYYRFDSASGTVATNSATATGAAFNGTLMNSPAWVPSTVAPATALNSVVTNSADSGPGTLRMTVSSSLPGTTITFATNLSGATITLTNGELLLNHNLTIDASALPGGIVISGNNTNRIFHVTGDTVVLNSLTITNGNAGAEFGGGIFNAGNLTLNQCTVVSNTTTTLGGGAYNGVGGTLTVNSSTFANNSSASLVWAGGAIDSGGTLTVENSTFIGNSANGGGAIYAETGSFLTVIQSTIVGNTAFCCGGGISVYANSGAQTLVNSIVAGNSAGDSPDIYFANHLTVTNHNLVGVNPLLAPLGNYGGPTPTMPPLPGSPAIDAAGIPAGLATDQRGPGFPRVMNFYADIGAVEALVPSIPNASFEVDDYTNQPGYAGGNGGIITGWSISDPARIGLSLDGPNSPGPFANSVVPDGTNFAFIQSTGPTNSLSTTLSGLVPGTAYQVTLRANSRGGYTLPVATWSLNGDAFVPLTSGPAVNGSNPYYTNSGVFLATSNTAPLIVRNGIAAGDSTLLVDAFTVAPYVVSVTTTNDGGIGSLRAAIAQVPSGTTLTFASNLSGSTITLTNGELVLNRNLTIDASALRNGIAINGNNAKRIFQVAAGNTCTLTGLIITNGNSGGSPGGGIENDGTLTLNQCTVVSNTTIGLGGGAYNSGSLTVNNCTFAGNSSASLHYEGGAIDSYGTLTVNQSTFTANSANGGGAIFAEFGSTLTVKASTIVSNVAFCCGGGVTLYATNGGQVVVDSIVAGNGNSDFYFGIGASFTESNHILAAGNPLVASLGNYGGPTQTMPPLPGSPAIDAGNDAVLSFLSADQRGYPRLSGAHVDIGAVEVQIAIQRPTLKHSSVGGGAFQFGFTNLLGGSFSVLSTTNLALPLNQWSNLGAAVEMPPGSGNFQFTDPQATNGPRRFYRVRSP